jgi:hypothetical protein
MALITEIDIENKLGRELTSDEVLHFTIVNDALQAEIERMIGSGIEEATATTRYYDGGVQHLAIDPCTDVTAVAYVDDDQVVYNTLDTTDYVLDPVNSTMKTQVRHRVVTPIGISNVAVTAKFSIYGDDKVLAIVKNAIITAIVGELQNTFNSNVKRESIEGYSVEYATDTVNISTALNSIKYLFPGI